MNQTIATPNQQKFPTFAHLADCHLGAWRDQKMKVLATQAFQKAITICKEQSVDFVLIAGDLFNTAMPDIETLHGAADSLQQLKDANIPVYLIAGSHDYAPSGKTFLDIFERLGLFTNVCRGTQENGKLALKWTIDKNTNTYITGILGKAGMLDTVLYHALDHEQLTKTNENAYKIFMFHTALEELKLPSMGKMHAHALSLLPKGCDYYAGGHVHTVQHTSVPGYKHIVYPGPLFPANIAEIEELHHGGFFIVENDTPRRIDVQLKTHKSIHIDITNKTVVEVKNILSKELQSDYTDAIVTVRLEGLLQFPMHELQLQEYTYELYKNGAYAVLKSTSQIQLPDVQNEQTTTVKPETIENESFEKNKQHLAPLFGQTNDVNQAHELLQILSAEKQEGESKNDYEQRILSQAKLLLKF